MVEKSLIALSGEILTSYNSEWRKNTSNLSKSIWALSVLTFILLGKHRHDNILQFSRHFSNDAAFPFELWHIWVTCSVIIVEFLFYSLALLLRLSGNQISLPFVRFQPTIFTIISNHFHLRTLRKCARLISRNRNERDYTIFRWCEMSRIVGITSMLPKRVEGRERESKVEILNNVRFTKHPLMVINAIGWIQQVSARAQCSFGIWQTEISYSVSLKCHKQIYDTLWMMNIYHCRHLFGGLMREQKRSVNMESKREANKLKLVN